MIGHIVRCEDHGTIVLAVLQQDDGQIETIAFDHRPFGHFWEDFSRDTSRLVEYDPETDTVTIVD